jgi:hypothetical protein
VQTQETIVAAQIPDKLINNHPRVELDGLHLHGVVRGDVHRGRVWGVSNAFDTQPSPPPNASWSTDLCRRYIATFVLQPNGELELLNFQYPVGLRDWHRQEVNEKLVGDFWILMRPMFSSSHTYIPFRSGCIIEDVGRWVTGESVPAHTAERPRAFALGGALR